MRSRSHSSLLSVWLDSQSSMANHIYWQSADELAASGCGRLAVCSLSLCVCVCVWSHWSCLTSASHYLHCVTTTSSLVFVLFYFILFSRYCCITVHANVFTYFTVFLVQLLCVILWAT